MKFGGSHAAQPQSTLMVDGLLGLAERVEVSW
jgi:hypothetical protein